MVSLDIIQENLSKIQEKIEIHARKAGMNPEQITLIGVTKTFDVETVRNTFLAGIQNIGESKVQEALPKIENLGDLQVNWHFIGHLQTNKVKHVVGKFSLIQSVDSLKLAKEIDKIAAKNGLIQPVLIEVNASGEVSKFGLDPEDIDQFMETAMQLQNIKIKGFMTIGAFTEDENEIRLSFIRLRNIFEKYQHLKESNLEIEILSMGMTDDFHLAIEEGSNMIRIGRGLFGPRYYH